VERRPHCSQNVARSIHSKRRRYYYFKSLTLYLRFKVLGFRVFWDPQECPDLEVRSGRVRKCTSSPLIAGPESHILFDVCFLVGPILFFVYNFLHLSRTIIRYLMNVVRCVVKKGPLSITPFLRQKTRKSGHNVPCPFKLTALLLKNFHLLLHCYTQHLQTESKLLTKLSSFLGEV